MDAATHKKPAAMPTRQTEVKPLSVECKNAKEKTDDKLITKFKLNPYAKEFIPSSLPAARSHACVITAPKEAPANCKPKPPYKPSMKPTSNEKSTEVLQNLLNEFNDKSKQIARIKVTIAKTRDKVAIEVISKDKIMCNVAKTNEAEEDETITIDFNTKTLVKAKQHNLLVAKLFRSLSEVINRKIREDFVEQSPSHEDEEEIANQIERINMFQTILNPDFKANEAIVQRAIHSLCAKLGIPENELNEMLEDSKDEKDIAAYTSSKTSQQLSDSRDESFCSSEITNKIFKFECFEDYEVHINELSESDTRFLNFDIASIDAPPTTPALSTTALNDLNFKTKLNKNKRLANTMRNAGRITLPPTFKRDALNEKSAACRNSAGMNRLRGGGISHRNQTEQKKLGAVVEAARQTTKTLTRNAAIKWTPLEHGEKKKFTKVSAARKDEKCVGKSSSEKGSNGSSCGGTKLVAAYKTVTSKTREKRLVPNQKFTPRGTNTTAMRQKETKKANMLWKL